MLISQLQSMESILQQQFLIRFYNRPMLTYATQCTSSSASKDSTYIFTQAVAARTWTINHNLGQFPSVTIVDNSGNVVLAQIQYINSNQIVLSFSQPFAGSAYLNV